MKKEIKINPIAIIIARGNSVSIKNKNLKIINKKPLLEWSINHCKESRKIRDIWVSSDSKKILNFAQSKGVKIIKRPKKYSRSNSSSESAWLHAINHLEKKKIYFDTILAPQVTSPIRGKNDFDNAIKIFVTKKLDSMFSATKIRDHFVWKKKNNYLKPNYDYKDRKPRQKIAPNYLENGSFFIFNKSKFKKNNCRMFGKIGIYVQDSYKSFQIDEKEDLIILESIMKNIRKFT